MLLCVASNGLGVPPHAEALGKLAVSHVTLTVNAVDPQIGAKVYAWIRDGKKVYRGLPGGRVALEPPGGSDPHAQTARRGRQDQHDHHPRGERRSRGRGCAAGRRPGRRYCQLRARSIPCPARPSASWNRRRPIAWRPSAPTWPNFCRSCRTAPAAAPMPSGCWARRSGRRWKSPCLQAAGGPLNPAEDRPYVAVATLEGVLVNQHLGEADQLSIYAKEEAGFRVVEQRRTPPAGNGSRRWTDLADTPARLPGRAGGQRRPGPARGPGQPGNQARDDGRLDLVYGEQDLVVAMASLLMEIGIDPVLCGSGARTGKLRQRIEEFDSWSDQEMTVMEGVDFAEMEDSRRRSQARSDRGQQQGIRHVAEARRAADPHRFSGPRSDRRAADAARRLSRCAATLRSHRQRRDRSRPGSIAVGYTYM